jgi:ribonuclease HI
MASWHVDGFTLGRQPSPRGGGFTVVRGSGALVVHHTFHLTAHAALRQRFGIDPARWFTNNEAELWAVLYATWKAGPNDTIYTDSNTAWHWVRNGWCKARNDLDKLAYAAAQLIDVKDLTVVQIPRDENLAGIYNETHDHEGAA